MTNKTTNSKMDSFLTIYRKIVSNLKIREQILQQSCVSDYTKGVVSDYTIGPTIIWTEKTSDIDIFTTAENYTHFVSFEEPFNNPRSKQYITKILKSMRMVKGTILIKEATPTDSALHIPVHFCGYRIDNSGVLSIFDPSWHKADPGIYSTTAFYDTLDAFKIPYVHALPNRKHHWQSLLPHDVFCQTWTLQWLYTDNARFPLPKNDSDAAKQMAGYIREFIAIVQRDTRMYASLFPKYKLEGNTLEKVCKTILNQPTLENVIHELF